MKKKNISKKNLLRVTNYWVSGQILCCFYQITGLALEQHRILLQRGKHILTHLQHSKCVSWHHFSFVHVQQCNWLCFVFVWISF